MKLTRAPALTAVIAATLASSAITANAATPTPTPTAIQSGATYVKAWLPPELAGPTWNAPANDPGQCAAHPAATQVNTAGNAQLTTTGKAGDCVTIQSPHKYPTKPGYIYETRFYASTMLNWSAWWMYGEPWPDQGEVDAFEPQFGTNYASWHSTPCNSSAASSTQATDPWTYPCKTTVKPSGADITAGWHTLDMAYTTTGADIYYDGHLYAHLPETLTASGTNSMWIDFSEGSCNAGGAGNTCAPSGEGTPGNVQVAWMRVWT
jgi:hypothetical protein